MIKRKCEQCGREFPMNETIRVADRVLCDACGRQVLAGGSSPQTKAERQADPTVCVNCRSDNGSVELPRVAGLPVCGRCETFLRNRPFPAWIKIAFAAVLALVAVSLVWNLRFFQAYAASKASFAALGRGDIEGAFQRMSSAARHVPECADLGVMAAYLEGVTLLQHDRCAEALAKLKPCEGRLPPQFGVAALIAQARCGAAFDAKDYDGFLAAAQLVEQQLPNDGMSKATVASAWACKYAQTGDALARQNTLSYLEQATKMKPDDPELKKYENRILHRLHSRQILTRAEFARQFPNGWSEQNQE
jgi:DNA-directed RNA polymerase subunit RPC12/RpoP